MTDKNELRSLMALSRIYGLGLMGAQHLLSCLGSATNIFANREHLRELIPDVRPNLMEAMGSEELFHRADVELEFAEKNNIRCLTLHDEDYPSRLRECDDAPLILFYRGAANLNALKVVSVVGTRRITRYGKELCDDFVRDLSRLSPDVLVVSGLAYGVDVQSHRAALSYGLSTVGVLAHGLDMIYPSVHRETAKQMCAQGGLLTEYMSGTVPEKRNFVQRNRIVAGMADAVVVVESAAKGGALITADLAQGYHRDCFAFPGRAGDEYSCGCNNLVRDNKAALITCASDLVKAMGWESDLYGKKQDAVQRQLFIEMSEDEEFVYNTLKGFPDGIQINRLVIECDTPVNRLNALLFSLEMKGAVKTFAGGVYKAI